MYSLVKAKFPKMGSCISRNATREHLSYSHHQYKIFGTVALTGTIKCYYGRGGIPGREIKRQLSDLIAQVVTGLSFSNRLVFLKMSFPFLSRPISIFIVAVDHIFLPSSATFTQSHY